MASMASRFQRRTAAPDERVGEILSDSNSEISSVEDGDFNEPLPGRNAGGGTRAKAVVETPEISDDDDKESRRDDQARAGSANAAPATGSVAAKVHQRPSALQAIKRKNSKWYDSDDDDWHQHDAAEASRRNRPSQASGASSASTPASADTKEDPLTNAVLSPDASKAMLSPESAAATAGSSSKTRAGNGGGAGAGAGAPSELGGRRSSFQRLVDKTFNRSPFATKRKGLQDVASPASSGPDTPRGSNTAAAAASNQPLPPVDTVNPVARMRSPLSDASSVNDNYVSQSNRRVSSRNRTHDPSGVLSDQTDIVSPQSVTAPTTVVTATGRRESAQPSENATPASRRRSHMIQSPNGPGDDAGSRRGSDMGGGEALSPGQRKFPGAFPGRAGSGVLLEGWLRQKQRRGVKGMKKWNSRYFVLYARTNEVRYYADVVQSAWGPIPLGEIGSISLRLIQRIGKPGNPKYKGCRLDITCRNTWGTHYADDYVSSEDENNNRNYNNSNGAGNDEAATAGATPGLGNNSVRTGSTDRRSDKNSTPKSSRVYSLMADSPQTTGAWFSMLDSLLVRSANSPRVDAAPASKQLKRAASTTKMATRRRSGALESESLVLVGAGENVPRAVLFAISYLFDSTPGIETEQFYEKDPDPSRLKSALKFLNQFAIENPRKPTKEELEQALDPVTAGAVVKVWLRQMEQPVVPFEMFEDFRALAADAKTAPFELQRSLKALVKALPQRNFAMLAYMLFHLNDVSEYASKNRMDAAVLASIFGEFLLRPRSVSAVEGAEKDRDRHRDATATTRVVVEEMISHVDAIIDEKEAEIMDRI